MNSSRHVAPRRARPILGEPSYRSPSYHSRLWGRFIFIAFLLAFIVVIVLLGGLYYTMHRSQSNSASQIPFAVRQGDSITTVANRLQSRGLIDNALVFRIDARLQGLSNNLKVGDFTLRRNMSIDQMVAALGVYHAVTIKVTIPEGYRMEQIAAVLQSRGIDAASFLQEARHPNLRYLGASILADKPAGASLEGYLYPNTYEVPPHSSGRAFARGMVRQLDADFTPAMRAAARSQHWSIYQILTLASIVEREARVPDERATIASVYINRLRNDPQHQTNRFLGADPTVQYIVGRPSNWWPVLQTQAVNVDPQNPYNTYTHAGLPPGPIANPGYASIRSTVYPAHTRYLFFVAKGLGRHAFAETYAQQQANQALYQH